MFEIIKSRDIEKSPCCQDMMDFSSQLQDINFEAFDFLPDAILVQKKGKIVYVNDELCKLLCCNRASILGRSASELLQFNNESGFKEEPSRTLDGEYKIENFQSKIIYVDIKSKAKQVGLNLYEFITLRDITLDRKEYADIKEKAEFEFFANMSHELRTPLNILLSSLQLMEVYTNTENSTKGSPKRYLGIMKQNCYRLLKLINNLLDITKIDSGYYKLKVGNHDIIKTVEDITQSVAEYMKEKGIEIIFDTDVEEKVIGCDADIIERVMLNLLSNAVKFTKPGGRIEVNIHEAADSINITVRDNGSGIPQDKLSCIFDRFIQVDKSLSRINEGTGIGLALVKSLIDLHKGNISVSSEYGEYTQFDITLPCRLLKCQNETDLFSSVVINGLDDKRIDKMNIEFSDIYL